MTITNEIKILVKEGFFNKLIPFTIIRKELYLVKYSTLYPVIQHCCTMGILKAKKNKLGLWEYIKNET